jgi:hypothetical protein
MKTCPCKGTIKAVEMDYPFESKIVGRVLVPKVLVQKCTNPECGEIFLSPDAYDKIFAYMKEKEREAIDNVKLSKDELLSARQTHEYLKITRQALSKPKSKYQRGFIFWRMLDKTKVYFRKSVEQFKETGDGRYLLKKADIILYKGKLVGYPDNIGDDFGQKKKTPYAFTNSSQTSELTTSEKDANWC